MRRPIELVFNRMGYEVIEANSAASGREQWMLHYARIDAVVSDNLLGPGPTGLSLLRAFLKDRPNVAAVLISGVLTSEIIDTIQSTSTIRCMQKPFDFKSLVELVARRIAELNPK